MKKTQLARLPFCHWFTMITFFIRSSDKSDQEEQDIPLARIRTSVKRPVKENFHSKNNNVFEVRKLGTGKLMRLEIRKH